MTMNIAAPTHRPSSGSFVALVLPNLTGGGAQRVMFNLASGLRARGHGVDIVVRHLSGSLVDAVPCGCALVDLRARRATATLVALVRYLRSREPAAVLSALPETNVLTLWAARLAAYRGRVIVSEHSRLFLGAAITPYRRAFLTAMRLTYPLAHRVIAVSNGVKDSLTNTAHIPPHHIDVIYNPVITPHIHNARTHTPDHPHFHDGTPTILGIGRLSRQKNFPNLIRAFALVRATRPATLLILGEGEERDTLTKLIHSLDLTNDVDLPGFVDNPYAYLAHAQLFALSSDWEGLPTVLIEALATDTPVVSTDCPSGPREILDNGRYGHLVPTNDHHALANAIIHTLDNPPPPIDPTWLDQFTLDTATTRYAQALGLAPEERGHLSGTDMSQTAGVSPS